MSHTTVKPVRLRYHNEQLETDASRVLGYRGTCQCGWKGPRRDSVSVAREDGRIHRASCTA